MKNPPEHIVEMATMTALYSPCLSKRGVVIFKNDILLSHGYNFIPRGGVDECTSNQTCKRTCRRRAVHAEQMALMNAKGRADGHDLLHVKAQKIVGIESQFLDVTMHNDAFTVQTVNRTILPSGLPNCLECSKLMIAAGISGVWLFHDAGWKRWNIEDFHRESMAQELWRVNAIRADVHGNPIEAED